MDHYAAIAKAQRKSAAFMPCALLDHQETGTAREELATKAVFVGEMIGSAPVVADDMIWTWYKFRIDRDISSTPLSGVSADFHALNGEIAPSLLPLQLNEIIVARRAGQAAVDGISVTYCTSAPAFSDSERYLLFLSLENDGTQSIRVGITQNESWDAIFVLQPDGDHFRPAYPEKSPFQLELMKRFHNSIEQLASAQNKYSKDAGK